MKSKQAEQIVVIRKVMEVQASEMQLHDFHELVYIFSGRGVHRHHQIYTAFEAGDLFFVRKDQEHAFQIDEPAEVCLVRISENARLQIKEMVDESNGRAVPLRKAQSPLNPKVTFSERDRPAAEQILAALELLAADPFHNQNLCYFQLMCLIGIIERNVSYASKTPERPKENKNISAMLGHIHKNLRAPELLSLEYMASKFFMTRNAFGAYFRKEMNQSVKQYVLECRMKAVAERVALSESTFSEIAADFGFVDESHFYKAFKKHFETSPTIFRQQQEK